ncbi:MAG: LptF/LptG family permease, partial [Syntrophales bacterium LBB04]|nr:LptF/LptG family permease [Syntrophales bacterium LBB04]
DAEKGEWRGGRWVLTNLITTRFSPGEFPEISSSPQEFADLPESPDNFKTVQKNAENMGYLELRKYIREIQSDGYDATSYLVDMHAKLAFPIVNIIMAIIGIASSIKSERKGGMAQGLATGIVIGFSYWIVFAFNVSLGHAGGMPPLLSAWAANILFGLAASFLFSRVRT